MSKINKVNYFMLITSFLFGVNDPNPIRLDEISFKIQDDEGCQTNRPPSSSSNMDPNLIGQVFGSVSRGGYFPSVSNFKTCGEAVRADRKAKNFIASANARIDEYKKYFKRQSYTITLHGNRNDESEIKYINDMKEHFLIQIMYSIRLFENNDPKIMPFKNLFKWREKECTGYIQDHLLDILMALTSDNPRVAALGLPPLDQIEDKETAIDQILDTLAPDLDQCDKDIENRLLAHLILLTRRNPTVTALGLLTANEIDKINEIKLKFEIRNEEQAIDYILNKIDRIENKKQAIDNILDIVCPIRISDNDFISRIIDIIHNNYKNKMELIPSIRRNRRNIEKLDDYSTLLHDYRDAERKVESLRDLLINRDNEGLRQTAAIMQTAKGFNQNSE